MNRKFYFSFIAFALTLIATVAFVVGHGTRAASPSAALSALPASDFVVVVDAQRAFSETLPAILAGNPALLAKMNAELEEFEKKTGINPRLFESLAVGGRFEASRPNTSHVVLITNGSFKADDVIASAFTAAKAEGRQFQKEEQVYEGKTIFVISSVRQLKNESEVGKIPTTPPLRTPLLPVAGINIDPALYKNQPYDRFGDPRSNVKKTGGGVVGTEKDSGSGVGFGPGSQKDAKLSDLEVLEGKNSATLHADASTDKFAVTALDSNTLAMGDLESVRAAIDASMGRNRVDAELVQLATQTPNAVVSFSGKLPQSASEKSNAQGSGNPFAKYAASIREFYGSFDVNGSESETIINLRTENADQARDISQAINSFKVLAKLGVSQSASNVSTQRDTFAAALKGLSITAQDNEVRIDVKIPQASLAPLIRVH
jgi:hypothetical protein